MTDTAAEHAGLDQILEHIDVASMRGLEIGPLHNPVVSKSAGRSIGYVDHADTDTLRRKYADDPNVPFVLDVDYVWGDRRLADSVNAAGPFDYVIASHVIEHVPDLVSWLNELAEVLRPRGVLSLVIPDKRFCFDARRGTTDVSEIVEASLEKRRRPSLAQIFDFESRYINVDTLALWAGRPGYGAEPVRTCEAYEKCVAAMSHDEYVDVHATTWTPSSFADVLRALFELDMVPFRVAVFHPTPFNSLEFYVTLERLDDDLPVAERREMQLVSLPDVADEDVALVAPVAPTDGRVLLELSTREAKLLDMKRRIVGVSRRAVHQLRRAVRPRQPPG